MAENTHREFQTKTEIKNKKKYYEIITISYEYILNEMLIHKKSEKHCSCCCRPGIINRCHNMHTLNATTFSGCRGGGTANKRHG
jgi:hypothetical protein